MADPLLTPAAYLVSTTRGDAVFLDLARALEYAAHHHGSICPLYRHAKTSTDHSAPGADPQRSATE